MHEYELRLAGMQLWMNWRSDSVNTVLAYNMLLMTGTCTYSVHDSSCEYHANCEPFSKGSYKRICIPVYHPMSVSIVLHNIVS